MNSQEKFTAAMRRLAEERDIDLLVNQSWANTGRFVFQRRGSFAAILEFPFNFQTDYSSFSSGAGEGPLGRSPSGGVWSYVQGADHDLLIARIGALLDHRIAAGADSGEAP